MLQTLLATSHDHEVIATIALCGGFAIHPALRFIRMLLTRQAVSAAVERTAATERAIRDEAARYRIDRPGVEAPTILRTIRAAYHVDGCRYVRDMTINVIAGDPSPEQVTVWYRPEDPGSAALGTVAYGAVNAVLSLICATLAWAATMALIRS